MNAHGRTVRLFLVDGTPTGILTAEIMNWTGHLLVAPRSKLADALKRHEATKTGVYFLTGDDPFEPSRQRVYVGEGDSVIDRIKSHAKDDTKDFWTHACIVTSKDANLTKSHVRYLESRLVEMAKAAARATIANGNEPTAKPLPESDTADMEFFLSQLLVALPTLGFDFLRARPVPTITTPLVLSHPSAQMELVLSNKKHGIEAVAVELDGEVTVLAGSLATAKTDFVSNNYALQRQALINDGTLVPMAGNGALLRFDADATFGSPSAAAAVILNRNSNGRTEWRVKSTNQTLRDWQDMKLAEVS